ncbi:MAG TPA: hypothetical protein VG206_08640 [Terriglobia bacterium]|nr:hypothetical protein [Terriglobia bacterium]
MMNSHASILRRAALLAAALLTTTTLFSADFSQVKNLALKAMDGTATSWEPGVPVIPGHEPNKANDGSLRSYWMARPEALPADLGVEWPAPQTISSVVVRYFDGHSRGLGPDVARTQQWALLQYWGGRQWRDIDARLFGGDTSTARYIFTPITTTRVRLLFTEPPDPEFRHVPARAEIDVCEFEAYRDPPFVQ